MCLLFSDVLAASEHISKLHAWRFVRHSFIIVTTAKNQPRKSKHVIEKTILAVMLAAVRRLTCSFAETIICFSVSKLAPSFLQMWIISQVAQKLPLLELLPLKFDIKKLANCVPAMLIFQGPIFWQKNTKSGERIRTSDLQHVSLMCFLYTNKVPYE